MKTRITLATVTFASLFASSAFAQEAPASKLSASAQLELLPVGNAHVEAGDLENDEATATAFGVSGAIDYAVHPNVSVGFAPRVIFGVKASDAPDSVDAGTEYDLRARIKAHAAVAPRIEAYGFLAPGYSLITSPDEDDETSKGLAIGFGAGATYELSPTAFVSGELGYQLGFQGFEVQGQDVTASTSYLHVGVGGGVRF